MCNIMRVSLPILVENSVLYASADSAHSLIDK